MQIPLAISSVTGIIFVSAAASAIAGGILVLFPGMAKRYSDERYDNPLPFREPPTEAFRMRSEGSFRILGIGLVAVAALLAYYGYKMP